MPPGPLLLLAAGLVAIVSAAAGGDAHAQSVAPGVPLSAPEGIVMLLNGTVYVADTGNDRVQVFHPNGTFARSFGSPGDGPGEFSGPTGIHVHRNGTVYVADTGNDRVQVFHPNGTFARSFGSPGDGPGEFSGPEDVHIKYDGTIVVADTGNDRLQFFWPNGTFALAFGTTGAGTGQFNGPTSVYFLGWPDRFLGVTDTGNDRVQLVDYDDNRGHADRPPVARFDTAVPPSDLVGGTRVKFDGPRSYAQGSFGNTHSVVADTGNHSIQVIGALFSFSDVGDVRFGSFGAERGNFSSPAGVDMTMAGEFAVADTGNDRIQVFHANRTVKFVIGQGNGTGPAPPAPPDTPPPANGNGTGPAPPAPPDTPPPANGNGTGPAPPAPPDTPPPANGNGTGPAPPAPPDTPPPANGNGTGPAPPAPPDTPPPANGNGTGPAPPAPPDTPPPANGNGTGPAPPAPPDTPPPANGNGTGPAPPAPPDTPPPAAYTCSVGLGAPDFEVSVRPGEYSAPVRQVVRNSGNLTFATVELTATPWRAAAGGAPSAELPVSATEWSAAGPAAGYSALAGGSAVVVARGLEGGDAAPLWFRINLAPHGGAPSGVTVVQHVTYVAECAPLPQ